MDPLPPPEKRKLQSYVSNLSAEQIFEKDRLIEIVNKEFLQGWSLGKNSSFGYQMHNGEHCWHVRLFGRLFGGLKT